MSEYTPPQHCVICLDPTSLCVCDDQPHTKLALQIVRDAPAEPETVTIGREAFLLLCERAYAHGQQQSKQALRAEEVPQRWSHVERFSKMTPAEDGEWVRWSDMNSLP